MENGEEMRWDILRGAWSSSINFDFNFNAAYLTYLTYDAAIFR